MDIISNFYLCFMSKVEQWKNKLDLQPHPEGGFFKETYRSEIMEKFHEYGSIRNVSTGIYFLLTKGNFSAFHRIKSDEMWHFYDGDPIEIFSIDKTAHLNKIILGNDIAENQIPQAVIPAGCWFGSRVAADGEYGLAGCTVAPGFDFEDFEMGDRVELVHQFPQHEDIIRSLTR